MVKTVDDGGGKVFINVCGSAKIPAPGGWKLGQVELTHLLPTFCTAITYCVQAQQLCITFQAVKPTVARLLPKTWGSPGLCCMSGLPPQANTGGFTDSHPMKGFCAA